MRQVVPEVDVSLINTETYPQLTDASIADSATGSRGESLSDFLSQNRQDTPNRQEIIHRNWGRQLDFMEMLGVVRCIFCLLTGTHSATHVTESCRKAQSWPLPQIAPEMFATQVKDWSRMMPFPTKAASMYCPRCRFPLVGAFHNNLEPRQCKYNDFLNRTAWALWHNPQFHSIVYDYSQKNSRTTVNLNEVTKTQFQKWVVQEEESLGETNLFRLFSMIVRPSLGVLRCLT